MATTFPVQIMTPEGAAYEGTAEMVSTRTLVGSIGIRANHEPLMAMLDPTELRIYESETEIKRFAQGDGFLQMAENSLLMLVEEAIPVEELDVADLTAKQEEAQSRLDAADDGSAQKERAERDVHRWTRYLEIANS
ncbi:MAG: ATP synthase F1 subunit epsilon [Thermoleophilaceae bacterium]|jgi:F-type H+-transporting ATPase subunit epsilon|nr:ATP synthase F1 subunit epsilon [Thermoleophilaceae bacterium]